MSWRLNPGVPTKDPTVWLDGTRPRNFFGPALALKMRLVMSQFDELCPYKNVNVDHRKLFTVVVWLSVPWHSA